MSDIESEKRSRAVTHAALDQKQYQLEAQLSGRLGVLTEITEIKTDVGLLKDAREDVEKRLRAIERSQYIGFGGLLTLQLLLRLS